jgi:hypothetical protein
MVDTSHDINCSGTKEPDSSYRSIKEQNTEIIKDHYRYSRTSIYVLNWSKKVVLIVKST